MSVNCYWILLHRLPHPCNCCSCNSDAMAINGTEGEKLTEHCQVTKGELCHALCFLPYHMAHALRNTCPNCTRTHLGDTEEEGWGAAEDICRSTALTCFQVSAVSNSELCQWGYSNIFHRETPRAREGFTKKERKISKHIPRLSFSHELKWKYLWYHSKLSLE